MKKFTMFLCLSIIVAAFIFMFVFTVCLPRTTVSSYSILNEMPEFSFDSLFSGKYFSDFTSYFTDTVFGRDKLVDYEARIRTLYGIQEENEEIVIYEESTDDEGEEIQDETSGQESQDEVSNEVSGPETDNSSNENENQGSNEKVPPELSGSVLVAGDRAMEVYYGNGGGSMTVAYANTLNAFYEKFHGSVNVYSMVIPKSSAYYLEQVKGYEDKALNNKVDIDAISKNLVGVKDVNVYNILGQHANEEIFARTDHHWTALGAYYAASVFADTAGVAIDNLDKFTENRRAGYLGTYYSWSNNHPALQNNPEDFLAYYPDADYEVTYYSNKDLRSNGFVHKSGFFFTIGDKHKSSWYSTFINGDAYSVKAVSKDCKNGRKLLLVKDSYGNALAPFFLEGFEEIYIVDARVYERSLAETVEEFGITDVLFAECTFSAVGSSYINKLKEICK